MQSIAQKAGVMTRTVDDVLRDINNIGGNSVIWAEGDMVALRAEILALRAENNRIRKAVAAEDAQIQQTLGKALGYPWFKDDQEHFPDATEDNGVFTGMHVAATIAAEAAVKLMKLRAERDALRAAVRDAELQIFVHSRSDWNSKHAAVIARAREVGK